MALKVKYCCSGIKATSGSVGRLDIKSTAIWTYAYNPESKFKSALKDYPYKYYQ